MQLVLEATAGPHQGKKIVVRGGQVATFGRTDRADYAFPRDEKMSGLHFSLECQAEECRVRDLQSANGTFVNRNRVEESAVQQSDVIQAGKSSFLVHIEAAVTKAEPIPDYLKGIVPPGARSSGFSQDWREPAPPPQADIAQTDIESAGIQQSLPAEGTYTAERIYEELRLDVQPAQPSFLPPSPPPAVPAPDLSRSVGGAMRLVVEAVDGPHRGAKFALRAGDSISVGRTDRADFALARDSGLSSLHFAIRSTSAGFEICDLGSTNGTLLNGETVAATLLGDGDDIRAGQSRFKIRLEGAVAVPSSTLPQDEGVSLHEGVRDPDRSVRREALLAAVWTRQKWLPAYCRKLAEAPTAEKRAENWDAILLLAVLGTPTELPQIEKIAAAAVLGPQRFQAVGAFGHPALVALLLQAMAGDDPANAAAAGAAFFKITGCNVDSGRRVQIPPKQDQPVDEFEQEFLDEVMLPDASRAAAHWKEVQSKFSASTRVCRGFDLSEQVNDEVFAELDMESRWEVRLRGRYYGTWQGSLRDLEAV